MDFLSEAGRTTYVSRPTTAGLKSCERWQLNQGAVKAPSFVSVDQSTFDYKENHTLCVWSKKTFRDGEKKTSNDIIKVAGNRKNYNQRRTLNER